MENNIPTIEELAVKMFIKYPNSYSSFNRVQFTGKQLKQVGIEFARLHAEAALEAAKEVGDSYEGHEAMNKSILNAYSLTNIK